MTDSKTGEDKTLGVNPKKTLTLKRPEQGTVRQSFSHGRTKAVVVETKKRKFARPDGSPEPTAAPVSKPKPRPAASQQTQPSPRRETPRPQPQRPGVVLNELSKSEMEARRRALQDSKVREAEDRRLAALEAQRRAEEEELRRKEAEESARRQAEEDARLKAEAEARDRAEQEAARRAPAQTESRSVPTAARTENRRPPAQADAQRRPAPINSPGRMPPEDSSTPSKPVGHKASVVKKVGDDDDRSNKRGPAKVETPARPAKKAGEDQRRRGKLTLNTALSSDEEGRSRSLPAMRRRQEKFKRTQQQETREKISREVVLPETITVQELAQRMAERAVDVVKYFMKQGQIIKPGDVIDADTAELIAVEFGHTVKRVAESDVEEGMFNIEDSEETLVSRPPVVA